MRRLLPFLLLVVCLASAVAFSHAATVHVQTDVAGQITSDTTWTVAGSPYVLTGDVEVGPGVTLTIEPGVAVRTDFRKLQVYGRLQAFGTAENHITFESVRITQSPGTSNTTPFYIDLAYAEISWRRIVCTFG